MLFPYIAENNSIELPKIKKHMSNQVEPSFKEVYSGDFLQASLIQQLLEEHEIPVFLKNGLMGSIEPFAVSAGGFNPVSIDVPNQYVEDALALIRELESD